jgi:hypothetical protein
MSSLKALVPAFCVMAAMIAADAIFHPSSWTLVVATALATAVAYTRGRLESRGVSDPSLAEPLA